MSRSRPVNLTPHHLIEWFQAEKDPASIFAMLEDLRKNDYADNLKMNDDASVICKALTTDDVKTLNHRKIDDTIVRLRDMQKNNAPDPGDIIKMIVLFLEIIKKIIEAAQACKKPQERDALRKEIADQIKALEPNNPFLNFARVHFKDMDMSGANLQFANFSGAKFKRVHFDNAVMTHANLRDVEARMTSFKGADLSNANLRWSNLEGAELDALFGRNVCLKSFLQNNYPANVAVNEIPSIEALQKALHEIQDELECERLGEHIASHKMAQKLEGHLYHQMVENNIAKIAEKITDPTAGKNTMRAVLDTPFFARHGSAHFVRGVNSVLTGIHNLFSHHKREVPYFGSTTENKLVHYLNYFEKQIEATRRTQVALRGPGST